MNSARVRVEKRLGERPLSGEQQTGRTEALPELETSPSINTELWELLEQSSFPRIHPHPGRASRNKWPGKCFSLELVCKISLLSVNLHTVASLQQRADRWAYCSLSITGDIWHSEETRSWARHLMSIPPGDRSDCGPTALLCRGHLKAWGTRSARQICSRFRSDIFELPSVPFVKHQNREIQRKHKTEKKETALAKLHSIPPPAPPHSFPSRLTFLSPISSIDKPLLPTQLLSPRCQPTRLPRYTNAFSISTVTEEHTSRTLPYLNAYSALKHMCKRRQW